MWNHLFFSMSIGKENAKPKFRIFNKITVWFLNKIQMTAFLNRNNIFM